ncbi:MAG: 3-hydroxyacyl-ACP dehydratase FabZ family protein [Planctomycetota bacterium]
MPAAEPLFDIDGLDLTQVEYGIEDIRAFNPHRHEMEQISGIVKLWDEPLQACALRHVEPAEFWTRGHFPGNPLFPGVLMVEAGAQVASFCFHKKYGKLDGVIFGFGGLESVRFRGSVRPGDDLLLMVKAKALRRQRAVFDMQAWVDQKLVCEARVIGVTIPVPAQASSAQD